MLSTPPRLQPLELFLVGDRLRNDAPEVRRHRLGGRGEERQAPSSATARAAVQARSSPTDVHRRFRHRASSPSARPERRETAALAPLPDHDHADRDRRESGDRDQDRDQGRRRAVVRGGLGADRLAAGDAACLPRRCLASRGGRAVAWATLAGAGTRRPCLDCRSPTMSRPSEDPVPEFGAGTGRSRGATARRRVGGRAVARTLLAAWCVPVGRGHCSFVLDPTRFVA